MRTLSKMLTVLATLGFVLCLSLPAAATRAEDYAKWRAQQNSAPVPEPSSALVFGAGLLVASQIARRRRA